jgi:YggT family protein
MVDHEEHVQEMEIEQPDPAAVPAQTAVQRPISEREIVPSRTRSLNRTMQFVWLIAGVLEALIGIRILLKLMAANPASGFARFIYGTTDLFLAPFTNLIATPQMNGAVLEISSLIAMLVYALLFWLIARLIWLIFP